MRSLRNYYYELVHFYVYYTDKTPVRYFHMTRFKMLLPLFFHWFWIYLTWALFDDKHFISHALFFILCIAYYCECVSFIYKHIMWFYLSFFLHRILLYFKPVINYWSIKSCFLINCSSCCCSFLITHSLFWCRISFLWFRI